MKITNNLSLPAPLVAAVGQSRPFQPNRISITELIAPAQQRALRIKHDDDITEDSSDRLWALMGTLLHGVLAGHVTDDAIAEERLFTKILGWEITGQYDLAEMVFDGEVLTDWKLTSVWAALNGVKKEWEEQTNCYAELVRRAGRNISGIQIVTVFRDWSKNKARFEPSYPQQQVKVQAVPLWTSEEATEFLTERVRLHQEAAKGRYPDCTPEERWARPTQWAIMKKTQKKAVKLYTDKAAALKHFYATIKGTHDLVERPGESVRCESYCSASPWCKQFAAMKAEKAA